ncbi:ABC transporter substrate-binding protein [Pseudomonas aeruginosa]|uniref:ABC transporter substrate-binding protein n=1 Tax=Pseudomonas aeruginosa TaxID=287 RepID=UPI003968EB2B
MRLAAFSLFLAPLLLAQPAAAAALSVCTEASPEGFDVVQYNSLTTTNASADVLMNRLVEFDAGKGTVVPSLAERWSVSDDGLSYRFDLRQGVHFHSTAYFKPSRTLDADDVVFSFQRMLDPANPWHKVAQNGFPHAQSMQLPELIKRVEKSGDHQVLFVLDHPDATFLPMLSMGFASIYSAEYADQLMKAGTPEKLNAEPIGSGPFVFKRFQKDAVVRYAANPEYFAGKPAVDALIFAITPDANVRLQKLRRGECQIALSPKPLDVESARKDASLKVEQTPAFMTAFVALNTQHPPLDDPKVRQAINLAFDRTSYLQAVFEGSASAATGIYPPNTWSYARDIPAYPHAPEQARKLLAGKQLPELNIWTRPSGSLLNPNPSLGAQLLQADLAEAGIKANIRVIEWGELIRRAKNGEHDLLFMGWAGDNGDPDNWLATLYGCDSINGNNVSKWCDAAYDKLVKAAKRVSDQDKRSELYKQAQHILKEQVPITPIAHSTVYQPMNKSVHDFKISPFSRNAFYGVTNQP